MSTPEFNSIMERLDKLERLITKPSITETWVDEEEAMRITGLGKSSLRTRRKTNSFTWSSATGRKPKYLRKDLEDYITKNSTRC
jgi:hypothetical protein